MLSLQFPLSSIETKHSLPKPKQPLSSIPIRNPSLTISSLSLPQSRLFASTTASIEELEGGEEMGRRETDAKDARDSVEEEGSLPNGLQRESLPKHVAVIMDGNARWAKKRGYPSSFGHEAGVRSLRGLIEFCCKLGIRVLTVFAFSCDNWNRPKIEIEFLMSLFEKGIRSELENFIREGIRVSFIGDSSKLPTSLQILIADIEKSTRSNSKLQLIVAVSYSGHYDIVQACQKLAEKVKDGLILPSDINESLIAQELETNCTEFPYPDLLIRTSGELRVSNFLLWQLAYTELFVSKPLWPDFGDAEFVEALLSFQKRQRRFGGRN